MKKIIDPFIDFLPSIDLHGMDRVCARIKTEEFINDSIKLKNKRVNFYGKEAIQNGIQKVVGYDGQFYLYP